MQIDLDEADLKNVLFLIRCAWESGRVKSEDEGATLSSLRHKIQEALKPKEPEKK